ncbi:hypothetical protein GCM10023144_37080 [Pigmentiphaga soli]|uniref:Diguanylate cyclase n=1 Tax=Pigmentiphaga soli TaxID=1007095 RepID=A0ABP8HGS2_9BURK
MSESVMDDPRTGPAVATGGRAPAPADRALDSLLLLARQHFGVAAAAIDRADTGARRISARPGFRLPADGAPQPSFCLRLPLAADDGRPLGTLLLLDDSPPPWGDAQAAALREFGVQAASHIAAGQALAEAAEREAALRADGSRMALAIADSGTGIWDRDVAADEIHYSAGWKAILGYAEWELGTKMADAYVRVHPDDLAYVTATMQAHFDGQTPVYEVEHRLRCKDGSYKWVSSRGKVVARDAEGRALRMIGTTTDITERKRIEAELQHSATTDFLTQLPNRRHFIAQVDAELARIRREGEGASAVLMCDLDHFKTINDGWGHATGDLALRHFAGILRGLLDSGATAGRMGGEEFGVLLKRVDLETATAFARRLLLGTADTPLRHGGQRIPITVSIGVALMQAADTDADAVLSRGDQALYRAKQNGRNRVEQQL